MQLNLDKIKLPKRIEPCPILEAIVELRFTSSFPHDAIFGIIYKEFKDVYPHVEALPILQLPEIVREKDPTLLYKPYYKLTKNDGFLFQVGARVISLIRLAPYSGWSEFSIRFKEILDKVEELGIVKSFTRIGIRYINSFKFNIFDKVNISLSIKEQSLGSFDTFIRSDIVTGGKFISTLQIANNAKIEKSGEIIECSIIDIDTFIDNPKGDIWELIEEGHIEEKKLFFFLLKKDFLEKELNPTY